MKRILLLLVGAALVLSVSFAYGQNTTIYFNGATSGDNWNGYGTGFYGGTIGGVTASPGMICDDFVDHIQQYDSWTAEGVLVSSLTANYVNNDTRFGGAVGVAGYAAMAYLVSAMFTLNPNSAAQADYSQAIWYIGANGSGWNLGGYTLSSGAQTLVTNAEAYASSTGDSFSTYTNLWLYTALPPGQTSQEMWGLIPVPEGGAALMYLLLAGVTCFGAMFYSRRQTAMGA